MVEIFRPDGFDHKSFTVRKPMLLCGGAFDNLCDDGDRRPAADCSREGIAFLGRDDDA